MRHSTLAARDHVITARVLQGATCRQVAADYGLSATRIEQIVLSQAYRHGASALHAAFSLKALRAYYAIHQSLAGVDTAFPVPAWFHQWREEHGV